MTATRANGGLWIVCERRDGRRVITALGRIDRGTAPRLVSALARDMDDDPVALDLGAVEIADRPGAVQLFHAVRRLHARQRGLIVRSADPALRRALDNSGLAWRLELVEDRAMAGPRPAPNAATDPADRADLVRRGMRATTAARRAALWPTPRSRSISATRSPI